MSTAALFAAACGLFGSGCDLPAPEVRYVPESELQVLYCEYECPGLGINGVHDSLNHPGVVFINETLTGIQRDVTTLHEMVHYLQHMTRDTWRQFRELDEQLGGMNKSSAYAQRLWQIREVVKHETCVANESEAYRIGDRYLQSRGVLPVPHFEAC